MRRPSPTSSAVCRAIRVICSRVCSGFADASMPITRSARTSAAKPTIMPARVRPVTEYATM